eukprot:2583271-Ditylum_brightwellii.AAC.1
MTTLKGPVLLDFAAATSTQQERSVATSVPSPANFLPVTSVTINRNKKDEANYMTNMSHPDNQMAAESKNTIESEAAVLASVTAAIQGWKRPPERSHGLPHVVDK